MKANPLPLIFGCILLGGWVLFGLAANVVTTSQGVSLSSAHAMCQNALIAMFAGQSCHTVDNWYLAASCAFWLGLGLVLGYLGWLWWLRGRS